MLRHPEPTHPTLSGAEMGRVRPVREVEGGVYLEKADGSIENRSCALRLLSERRIAQSLDLARQYLMSRGDGKSLPGQISRLALFFQLHYALVEAGGDGNRLIFPPPANLADRNGRLNLEAADVLELWRLIDGELDKLSQEYDILRRTQAPPSLSHEKFQAIVNEGKEQSLRSLHSQYGSSALIIVLHGMDGVPWPA